MGKARRRYTLEFKQAAVKQVVQEGRSTSEVAGSLGINHNMLLRWRQELSGSPELLTNSPVAKDDEIRRLRRALLIAQQERDILKKAVAYFARDKN